MKKAIIVVPSTMVINRIEDNNRILRNVMAKECGFDILVMENIELDIVKKYDAIFIDPYKYLHERNAVNTLKLMELPIKIIAYGADMENPKKISKDALDLYTNNRNAFFLRSDIILCDVYENFKNICKAVYDKIKHKMIWWPKCVVDYDRYFGLPFNEKPVLKCTLAGKLDDRYALRKYIFKKCGKQIMYYPHPGYGEIDPNKYPIGDAFAKELNKYICGVCPNKINTCHVLEKHIIIPAAGSLLLTERTPDFDRLGMVDGQHYISITKENIIETINSVLQNPNKYRTIRFDGREYIKQNHTINNRMQVLKQILIEMGDG